MKKTIKEDELRAEYDLATLRIVERGPQRITNRTTVTLEPDVAALFPTSEAVNAALRQLIQNAKHGHAALGS